MSPFSVLTTYFIRYTVKMNLNLTSTCQLFLLNGSKAKNSNIAYAILSKSEI